jgi:hypothetical protein
LYIEENIDSSNNKYDIERLNTTNLFENKSSKNSTSSTSDPNNTSSQNESLIKQLNHINTKNKFEELVAISKVCEESTNPRVLSLLLEVYSNTNIDKAMILFEKNIGNTGVLKTIHISSIQNLISRCVQLDKTSYVIIIV